MNLANKYLSQNKAQKLGHKPSQSLFYIFGIVTVFLSDSHIVGVSEYVNVTHVQLTKIFAMLNRSRVWLILSQLNLIVKMLYEM